MELQKMPKLRQFAIEILIDRVKSLLQLLLHLVANRVMRGVMVHVREENSLRKRWFDVFA